MKGYKFLKSGYKSQYGDFTYEIGKEYIFEGEIEMCENGFHFSKDIHDAISYVNGDICVEIEASGKIIEEVSKCVCSKIKIIRELNIVKVFEELSRDKHWDTRYVVANNLNTPIEILKILSKDIIYEVRSVAINRLREIEFYGNNI